MECPVQPPLWNIESQRASKIIWRNTLWTFPKEEDKNPIDGINTRVHTEADETSNITDQPTSTTTESINLHMTVENIQVDQSSNIPGQLPSETLTTTQSITQGMTDNDIQELVETTTQIPHETSENDMYPDSTREAPQLTSVKNNRKRRSTGRLPNIT